MKPDEEYEQLKSMSMPELCAKIAQLEAKHTTTTLAKLALQAKQTEKNSDGLNFQPSLMP